jgi:hypothetical protein
MMNHDRKVKYMTSREIEPGFKMTLPFATKAVG